MVITVELDRDTDQRLADLAARTGKTKAEQAGEVIQLTIGAYEERLGLKVGPERNASSIQR